MTANDRPTEERILINEMIGLPTEDSDQIIAKLLQLYNSDMNMKEVVAESVKGCNLHDVMVGIALATLIYTNEGSL